MVPDNCPTEETLAAFADGRLDDRERAEVVEHLAACTDCREIAATASDYISAEGGAPVIAGSFGSRWMRYAAPLGAAALLVIALGIPLRKMIVRDSGIEKLVDASSTLEHRGIEGRLSGGFPYKPLEPVMRGSRNTRVDPDELDLFRAAGEIQNDASNDAQHFHALGQSHLLLGNDDGAVAAFQQALRRADDTAARPIRNDLAAALLDRGTSSGGRQDLLIARDITSQLWQQTKTPEVAWNRAVALERLGENTAAAQAWDDYLSLDSSSQWAQEARERRAAVAAE